MLIRCVAAMFWLSGCSSIQRQYQSDLSSLPVADGGIRKLATSIQSKDVAHLRFSGSQLGHVGDTNILVSDIGVIKRFLDALRSAVQRPGVRAGNRVNVMEIHLKTQAGEAQSSASFRFCPHSPLDCFGPKFQSALGTLGQFEAKRLRQKIRRLAPAVRVVQIGGSRYRDPKLVRQITGALQQVDGRAYAFTNPKADYDTIFRLILSDGSSVDLPLVVEPYGGGAMPPLPEPLWSLYSKTLPLGASARAD